jgi:hypothetical protein
MGGLAILERARKAGLDVTAEGGQLVVTGPKRLAAVARDVLANKDAILAILAPPPVAPTSDADKAWEKLAAMRWGPAVGDPEGGIIIEPNWRLEVANLPHYEWCLWRGISGHLLEPIEGTPTESQIYEAQRLAAEKIGISTR